MKKIILSVALALCICISFRSEAYAWQETSLQQEEVFAGESASGLAVRDTEIPTPTEVYEAMIALKDQDAYKEGTTWTDYEPYSDSKGYYHWKGGNLEGKRISAVGCVAFAFILSDAAFDSLPARMYAAGGFAYEDIKVGDILRVNNDTHTVIVLEVSEAGVVIAEGNLGFGDHVGKVHWGRAISKEEVMKNASHYITRYPSGYIPPDDPEADVSVASGTFGGGFTWNLTKAGTLTVSGNGAMPDLETTGEQPWISHSSQIRKIVIGNGITEIGSCAFWNCGVLSVEISPTVTAIGKDAFRSSSIISVSIPSNVKTIGDGAFRECENLSSVNVSEGLEIIGQNAFRSCTSLSSIALPASIGEVGAAAFFQCQGLTSATFAPGSKQVKLGDNMFTQCYYLMRVTLPKSIDRIGEGMFQNCLSLAGIEIPQGAESIGASAFASCSKFTVVIIPDSVTSIGMAAFASCYLTDIYFTGTEEQWNGISKSGDTAAAVSKAEIHYNYVPPANPDTDQDNDNNEGNGGSSGDGGSQGQERAFLAKDKTFTVGAVAYKVTKVGEEVELILSKSASKKVTVDTVTGTDGVNYKITAIGPKAMQNNKKIKNLVIGDHVRTIGESAFSGCNKMTKVTIGKTPGSSLTAIGKSAFKGCKKLGKVTIKSTKLSIVGKQAFKGAKGSLKVKAPSVKLKNYKKIFKKSGLKAKQITK